MDDSTPSLGETRAADASPMSPPGRPPLTAAAARGQLPPTPPLERTTSLPSAARYNAPRSLVDATQRGGPNSPAPVGSSRFCGTCGARITPGEAFCGQCGTPVGASSSDFGNYGPTLNAPSIAAPRYPVGTNAVWGPEQPQPTHVQQGGAVRGGTTRIVLGLLCLVGSLVSAVVAVVTVLQTR